MMIKRILKEEKFEVIGTRNFNEVYKSIVSYDLTYKNTEKKNITNIIL